MTFAMASLKSTAFSMGTGRIIVSPDVITFEDVRALAILWAFTPSRLAAEEMKSECSGCIDVCFSIYYHMLKLPYLRCMCFPLCEGLTHQLPT